MLSVHVQCFTVNYHTQKHVFEPPHRRIEANEERQREIEHAFEDMYMAQTSKQHMGMYIFAISFSILHLCGLPEAIPILVFGLIDNWRRLIQYIKTDFSQF